MNMQGKVVIVTGGASGMGEAEVRLLVASGAKVVFTDRDIENGKRIDQELGDDAIFRPHDVSVEADWQAVVAFAEDHFGRIDGLVNNAGVHTAANITEVDVEEALTVIRINQIGQLLGMKHVVPAMRRAGSGSIVNTGSETGTRGAPGSIVYSGTKAAIAGQTRSASTELAKDNIRVNLVAPGPVDTPMITGSRGEGYAQKMAKIVPLGRVGEPKDIASLVVFLLSDDSSYITGAEIAADGGRTAAPATAF